MKLIDFEREREKKTDYCRKLLIYINEKRAFRFFLLNYLFIKKVRNRDVSACLRLKREQGGGYKQPKHKKNPTWAKYNQINIKQNRRACYLFASKINQASSRRVRSDIFKENNGRHIDFHGIFSKHR